MITIYVMVLHAIARAYFGLLIMFGSTVHVELYLCIVEDDIVGSGNWFDD